VSQNSGVAFKNHSVRAKILKKLHRIAPPSNPMHSLREYPSRDEAPQRGEASVGVSKDSGSTSQSQIDKGMMQSGFTSISHPLSERWIVLHAFSLYNRLTFLGISSILLFDTNLTSHPQSYLSLSSVFFFIFSFFYLSFLNSHPHVRNSFMLTDPIDPLTASVPFHLRGYDFLNVLTSSPSGTVFEALQADPP
jgi:hypothetical protein